MGDAFDPYHIWLGIPPAEQPPNHYRLLGIPLFESNREVIVVAASRQTLHIKAFSVGQYAEISQSLLKQLSRAKLCLLNSVQKADYDLCLRALLTGEQARGAVKPAPELPGGLPPPIPPYPATGRAGCPPPVPSAPVGPAGSGPRLPATPLPVEAVRAPSPAAGAAAAPARLGPTSSLPVRGGRADSGAMVQPDSWVIGSADDCDVVVRKPTVSGHHCRLRKTPEGYVLEDLSSANGTYVNGHRVEQPTAVTPQDRIRLGRRIVLPWPAAPSGLRAIRIGALPDNHVVLDQPVVSGHHAVLWIEQGRMTIEDLGSTNGTSVGPRRRRVGRARVSPGDTLYFGSYAIPVARLLELADRKA